MEEIAVVLREVESDSSVRSAVLISNKPNCFIAGADIAMLQSCKDEQSVYKISKDGQEILSKIADSKKPIVAAIQGSCLGGGLEVFFNILFIKYSQVKGSENITCTFHYYFIYLCRLVLKTVYKICKRYIIAFQEFCMFQNCL